MAAGTSYTAPTMSGGNGAAALGVQSVNNTGNWGTTGAGNNIGQYGSATSSTQLGTDGWWSGLTLYGASQNFQGFSNTANTTGSTLKYGHESDVAGGLAYLTADQTVAIDSSGQIFVKSGSGTDGALWSAYNPASGAYNNTAEIGKDNSGLSGPVLGATANDLTVAGQTLANVNGSSGTGPTGGSTGATGSTGTTLDAATQTAATGLASAVTDLNNMLTSGLQADATGAFGADKAFQQKFTQEEGAIQSEGTQAAQFAGVNAAGTMTGQQSANLTATGMEQKGVLDQQAQSAYNDLIAGATNTEIGDLSQFEQLSTQDQIQALQTAATNFATASQGAIGSANESAAQNVTDLNNAITAYKTAAAGSQEQQNELMNILKLIGGGAMVAAGAVASVTGVGAAVGAPLIAGGVGLAVNGGTGLASGNQS